MNAKARALVLALGVAGAVAGCHSIYGPTPIGENWRVIDTTHFSFNVRPDGFVEQNVGRLAEVLDDQYETTLRMLDIRYTGRISLFLYESAADGDLPSARAGKAYPDTESLRATAGPPLDDNLFGLLSHEMNHVIQQNAIGRPGTAFMGEGLPSAVISERFHQLGRTHYYAWTASNDSRIPSLSLLIDDDRWQSHEEQMKYKASASFLSYLLEIGGPQRLKQLQPLSSSHFAEGFAAAYGQSLEAAERNWRAFCASRGR